MLSTYRTVTRVVLRLNITNFDNTEAKDRTVTEFTNSDTPTMLRFFPSYNSKTIVVNDKRKITMSRSTSSTYKRNHN